MARGEGKREKFEDVDSLEFHVANKSRKGIYEG